MDDYISLSTLNDFIFCPYSIYLHNVYMDAEKDLYQAVPQVVGSAAHQSIDEKKASNRKTDLMGLPVCSEELGIRGQIDLYRQGSGLLVERKYRLKRIFKGQVYQLWGEYFCMKEMGYEISQIAFYEISTNKMIAYPLPSDREKLELAYFIRKFREYDPGSSSIHINSNKCIHCIYCNLCDKAEWDNVYT